MAVLKTKLAICVIILAALLIGAASMGANSIQNNASKVSANDRHTRKRYEELLVKAGRTSTWYIHIVDNGKILATVKAKSLPIREIKSRSAYNNSPWIILTETAKIIKWDGTIIVTNDRKLIGGGK